MAERTEGIGCGGGEKPYGAFITEEWLDEFQDGEVTIAVKSFLRFNDKYKVKPSQRVPQGRISLHLDEQKLPPMGDDLVVESATVVPMLCAEWQAALSSDNGEENPGEFLYRWDGDFVPNSEVMGHWEVVAEVPEIAEFDPEKKRKARRPAFSTIAFKDEGKTDETIRLWSGDRLMDLDRYQSLRMRVETIDGTEYLFIESGGFSERHKPGWKSSWLVLARP